MNNIKSKSKTDERGLWLKKENLPGVYCSFVCYHYETNVSLSTLFKETKLKRLYERTHAATKVWVGVEWLQVEKNSFYSLLEVTL